MRILVKLGRRLRLIFRRDSVEQEMMREMESHLEQSTREYERAGLPLDEARRRARIDFGNPDATSERARDARGGRALDDARSDARHAFRQLRHSPGHAFAAIGILGTAIAGAGLGLALVRAYLVRPLPYPEPERLMSVFPGPTRATGLELPDLSSVDWTDVAHIFEATSTWDLDGFTLVQPGIPAEYVNGAWVSGGYFRLLGLEPAVGRGFAPEEYAPGSNVAIISSGLWHRRFAGDPAVIGQSVRLHSTDRPADDALVMIVGVLPPLDWHLNRFTDVLRPLSGSRMFSLARLPVSMTRQEAERRMTEAVRAQVPIADTAWHMSLTPAQEEYTLGVRPAIRLLAGAALFLLLLAQASVGGLLLARATSRVHELALRQSLGATRARLVRQLAVEAFTVSALAIAVGLTGTLALGRVAGRAIEVFGGVAVPGGLASVRLDAAVIGLVIVVTIVPYLIFALLPLIGLARVDPADALSSSRVAGGLRLARTRQLLMAVQVAVAVALLGQGSLLLQSVRAMMTADLGFDSEAVLKAHVLLPRTTYLDRASRITVMSRMLERIERVPGVTGVAGVFPHPFRGVAVARVECDGCSGDVLGSAQTVTTGYFRAMGIGLVRGRMFDERDDSTGEASAIVSESLARKFFGSADPLERRIRLTAEDGSGPWLSVVGVVKDVRKTFSDTLYPDIYRPFAQEPRAYVALMVRTSTLPMLQERGVRAAVMAENEALALSDVEPMSAVIASRRAQAGMLALFVGGVGVLALIVTTAGLYAVVGYLVRLRRREFAVRIALGAEAGRIIRAVLEQARWMVVAGIVAGIALALGAGRLSRAWLMDISPQDPATFAAVTALVLGVVLTALVLPARRAARVDPASVLREE
jgi:putative ABC transport system permease protein